MKGFVIAIVVLTIIGGAAGAFFGIQFLVPNKPPVPDAAAAHAPSESNAHQAAADAHGPAKGHGEAPPRPAPQAPPAPKLLPLPPIVASLAGEKAPWIRIEASLVIEGEAKDSNILLAQVAEDFVAYLRSVEVKQIEGASGISSLKDDLIDRARVRSGGLAKALVIQGFIIE